jgi:hypothetical protein
MPQDSSPASPRWFLLTQALAALALPLVLAVVGQRYTTALKEREIEGRFVELALRILQAPPDSAHANLRVSALRVVNTYSGVALDSSVTADLRRNVALPASVPSSPADPNRGIASGSAMVVELRLTEPARITWYRLQRKDKIDTLPEILGPGTRSFTIPYGGTIFVRAEDPSTGMGTEKRVDCTRSYTCRVAFP